MDLRVYSPSGADVLQFGAGITSADLSFSRIDNNSDLLIEVDGGGSVTLNDYFQTSWSVVETIAFDGGSYDYDDIAAMA